jgi:hypothetical protein
VAFFGAGARASHNNIFRFNVCSNNGRRSDLSKQGEVYMHTWDGGSLDGVEIYNNTFYWNPATNAPALSLDDAIFSGNGPRFFKNNIVYATVPGMIQTVAGFVLDNNIYWTTSPSGPEWRVDAGLYKTFASYQSATKRDVHSYYTDPLLNSPGYHAAGRPTAAFHLLTGSAAARSGVDICSAVTTCSMGSFDFWGQALAEGRRFNIGADQSQ